MQQEFEISFRETSPGDIPSLVDFAKEIFDQDWSPEFIQWKYFHNPAGRFYGRVADVGGKPAGFYGNIPVRLKIGAQTLVGAQAVDAMIAVSARRLGLFTRLNEQTYRSIDQDGIILDYAFPNPASQAGFINRLGWVLVGQVPRYVKILDINALPAENLGRNARRLARLFSTQSPETSSWYDQTGQEGTPAKPGLRVERVLSLSVQVDALWKRVSRDIPIAIQRDRIYLDWRYQRNPLESYVLLEAWREDDLTGVAILSYKDFTSQGAASLVEWLFAPGDRESGWALLRAAEGEALQRGCAQIQCWMLPACSFYTYLLQQNGYQHHSARIFPGLFRYSTPFLIRPLPGRVFEVDPCDLSNWYLTMGDHDYY